MAKTLPAPISGFDARRDAVAFSKTNARAAGIGHLLSFAVRDLRDFRPPTETPGTIVCNPPYGERIGEESELRGLYRMLGEVFRKHCNGWTLFVFTGNSRLAVEIGQAPVEQTPLFNGKIPCQLLKFE
jgi:putative N6-adenine-specific DNA methylase